MKDTRWRELSSRWLYVQVHYIFETFINWNISDTATLIREIRNEIWFVDEFMWQLQLYDKELQYKLIRLILNKI